MNDTTHTTPPSEVVEPPEIYAKAGGLAERVSFARGGDADSNPSPGSVRNEQSGGVPVPRKLSRGQRYLRWAPAFLRTVGLVMFLLALVMLLPVAAPRIAGYETYTVETASMDPAIPVGALAVVKPEGAANLAVGDVVAYQRGDAVIVHRVVANQVVEGYLTTKGDANELEDQDPVRYESVIGPVVFSVPYLGTLGGVLTTLAGKIYFALFVVAALLMVVLANQLANKRDFLLQQE